LRAEANLKRNDAGNALALDAYLIGVLFAERRHDGLHRRVASLRVCAVKGFRG